MTLSFPLVGGAHWLNLINTSYVSHKQPVDLLQEDNLLSDWLAASGLSADPSSILAQQEKWDLLRSQLTALRDICIRVLQDLTEKKSISSASIDDLEAFLNRFPLYSQIRLDMGQITERYRAVSRTDDILYQIGISIVHTLQTVTADRIRKCEHEECILTFADTSKGGKRRWCSMDTCGNRHKAASFLKRKNLHS